MNEAFLLKALKIIDDLTPEELETKMKAFGIEFTRSVTYFNNVSDGCDHVAVSPVVTWPQINSVKFYGENATLEYRLSLPILCTANDSTYALAA